MKNNTQELINTIFDLDELQQKGFDRTKELGSNNILKKVYVLENYIQKAKEQLKLKQLDNQYYSESILKSFSVTDIRGYSAIDYQYYLLGFLLLEHKNTNPGDLMLHQIIKKFVNRVKNDSLSYLDIERTASGATRCHTNLRFAMQFLRDEGLVKERSVELVLIDENTENYIYYNPSIHRKNEIQHKKTWALSILGFWVAISLMRRPDSALPTSKKVLRDYSSYYKTKLSYTIAQRILSIQKREYSDDWDFVTQELSKHHLQGYPVDFEGRFGYAYDIIEAYQLYLQRYAESKKEERAERLKSVKKQVDELEKEYQLQEFMQSIETHFDAQKVFEIKEG